MDEDLPDSKWMSAARRRLLAWYRKHARDLPWRRTRDAYKIWVSEVMLQQTQVETVRPYYKRFLKEFPSVRKLAAAQEREVLRLWEGLGYYRRARQLHAAARQIVAEHRGRFPTDFDEVHALPGIGRYTAGAILSFSQDQRQPVLEGNTIRLHARLLNFSGDTSRTAGQRLLWSFAEAILPRKNCGEMNQALMELGSQVCKAQNPLCRTCPLSRQCRSFAEGTQLDLPNTGRRMEYESINEAAVVVRRGNKVLLRECQEGERWAGLWDFPRYATDAEKPPQMRRELAAMLKASLGIDVSIGEMLLQMNHGVTRYRITLRCFVGQYLGRADGKAMPKLARWVPSSELDRYPLSVTGRKISHSLDG